MGIVQPVKKPPRHKPFHGGTQISLPHSWPTIAPYTDVVVYSSHIRIQFDIYFNTIRSAPKRIKSSFPFRVFQFKICMHLSSLASKLCSYTLCHCTVFDHRKMHNGQYETGKSSSLCIVLLPHIGLLSRSLYFDPNVAFFFFRNTVTVQ